MKTRTALVACVGDNEGAWAFLKGNERGLMIQDLGQSERIFIEFRAATPAIPSLKLFYATEGPHSLPSLEKFDKYRVGKLSRNGARSPTTVEIMLDAKVTNPVP